MINKKNNLIIWFQALILTLILFNIFFQDDFILPSIDILHNFRSIYNFLSIGRPFSEFYGGSGYNWDNYDLFNYQAFYFDTFIFKNLNLSPNIKTFLYFKIIFKLLIILGLFFTSYKIFKSYKYSLIFLVLVLCDGSFNHVLHNFHHYLIISLLITFSLIYFKTFQNTNLNSLIIGFILCFGFLTLVVTGIVWGVTALIISIYLFKQNKIHKKQLLFFFIGIFFSIIVFFYNNYYEILEFYNNNINQIFNQNSFYIKYTIKYLILNTYHLIFGNHGNNFLIIYLIIIYFKRDNFKDNFDKNVFNVIFISIICFLIIGTIIDPLHYYPSRLGILTPIIAYLFLIIIKKNQNINFIFEKKIYFSLLIFLTASISKKVMDYEYNPNTFINSISVFVLFLIFLIILIFFQKSKKINIFLLTGTAILLMHFPNFKINEISSFFSEKKNTFINSEIKKITNEHYYDCIITNYPEYELFDNRNLFMLTASNLHSNKKNFWGKSNCELIVLIINTDKKDLNQFIKINYNKKYSKKINFDKDSKVFYNNNFFSPTSISHSKFASIIALKKIKQKISVYEKIIYLSYE